ncbi:MAG TPA: DUF2924 domain-containing protein [Pirellulales bacterium]|nr:DUF2924 domain-containing protein [Pirellulales bacterium]
MDLNIGKEVAALRRMTVNELRNRYVEVCGEAMRVRNKDWLVKRIAWRIQANAEGDLSERARRRATELANDAELPRTPPKTPTPPANAPKRATVAQWASCSSRLPPPGSIITRDYKGETLQVQVLPDGFEYEGDVYRSLSAVAKAITGSHCNGYLFFRLKGAK